MSNIPRPLSDGASGCFNADARRKPYARFSLNAHPTSRAAAFRPCAIHTRMTIERTWRNALLLVLGLTPALVWLQWVGPRLFYPPETDRTAPVAPFAVALGIALALCLLAWFAWHRLALLLSRPERVRALLAWCAVAAGGLGALCLYFAAFDGPGERAHRTRLVAGVLIGISAAFASPLFRERLDRFLAVRFNYYATIAISAAALVTATHWCGMHQFGGFDHSMVVDFGWRLFSGQRPVTDFPVSAPISFFVGAAYAYALFGVSWQAIVLAIAFFSAGLFLWSVWLVGQFIESRWHRLLLALGAQIVCVLPVAYWWYNPLATATGVVFSFAAYAWLQKARSTATQFSYCAALFLLATMKPNVAGILIFAITLVLLTSREHRVRVVVLSAATFVLFLLWLQLHDISRIGCLQGYRGVAGRGLEAGPFFADPTGFEALVAILTLLYVLLPVAACLIAGTTVPAQWRGALVGLACATAGFSNFLAAGETKLVDLGMVLIGSALVARAWGAWVPATAGFPRLLTAYLTGMILIASCAAVAVAVTRHRVRGIGPKMFFEYSLEDEPFRDGYFRGLRTGERFKDTYAQVSALVAQSAGKRLFFGPRMQWGYAAFRLPSPLGQPVWWHPGTSFTEEDTPAYLQHFFKQRHDLLILLKNDMTFYPPELVDGIRRDYTEDQSLSELTVFRLRSPEQAAPADDASPETARGSVTFGDTSIITRLITTSVSVDVPAIGPSGEFGTKVHLPGVQPFDQLVVSPTQFSGSWGVYFHSGDTVMLNYTNTTGAPIDPPPIKFRVTAIGFE